MGDPQGIGPEVIQKALRSAVVRKICRPVVFGDPEFFDFRKVKRLTPKQCGRLSALYIEQAVHAALRKEIAAIVTGPISKERLRLAGYNYPGHTEFLEKLTGARRTRMMMAGPRLKVVLETIHEPIQKIPQLISTKHILETIDLTNRSLRELFGIRTSRIAVAALNPHAGEGGLFGGEEKKIAQAVALAVQKKIRADGPFSPDTVFYRASRGEFDVVIAMYHDQGLIPLKLLHFDQAVNITLGLPIIRTSVDHGTAFDIAGTGKADAGSLVAAIEMAVALTRR